MKRLLLAFSLCFISVVTTTSASTHEECWTACYDQYASCTIELCGGKCPECVEAYELCLDCCD
jgi:hypothetical protein